MTTAFDERALRTALGRAAASTTATTVETGDLASRVDHRIAVHERRAVRRRRVVVGALAAFVVVAGILAYALRRDHEHHPVVPVVPHVPGWSPMSPAPIEPRAGHGQVWTGEEVLVLGGGADLVPPRSESAPAAGAAAYDPGTGLWRELADPGQDLRGAVMRWTGDELLVLVADGTLLAYDVDADRWEDRAPDPSAGVGMCLLAVWTGDELVVAHNENGGGPGAAAAYDPASDTWRDLPAPPVPIELGYDAAWTGSEVIALGRQALGSPGPTRVILVALDPAAEAWRVLPDPPIRELSDRVFTFLVWTGSEAIVGGGSSGADEFRDVAAYDPGAGAWRSLPSAPVPITGQVFAPEIWTGSEVLVWESGGSLAGTSGLPVLLDPATGEWRLGDPSPVGARQQAPATWAGSGVVWWSGEPTASDVDESTCCRPIGTGSLFTP